MSNNPILIIRFYSPVMTAAKYLSFSKAVLVALSNTHQLFQSLASWGIKQDAWTKLDLGFENLEEVVFQHIYDEELNYQNPDEHDLHRHVKSSPTVEMTPWVILVSPHSKTSIPD